MLLNMPNQHIAISLPCPEPWHKQHEAARVNHENKLEARFKEPGKQWITTALYKLSNLSI